MKRTEIQVGTIYAQERNYMTATPVRPVAAPELYVNLARYDAEPDFHRSDEQITKRVPARTGLHAAPERDETRKAKDWTSSQAGILCDELDPSDLSTVTRRRIIPSREIKRPWDEYAAEHNAKVRARQETAARAREMQARLAAAGIDGHVASGPYATNQVTLSYAEAKRVSDELVQTRTDSRVLRLAIERGLLSENVAASLSLSTGEAL